MNTDVDVVAKLICFDQGIVEIEFFRGKKNHMFSVSIVIWKNVTMLMRILVIGDTVLEYFVHIVTLICLKWNTVIQELAKD